MKFYLRVACVLFFIVPFIAAQKVQPTSLTITAVPGYSSSPQDVRFFNTGTESLTLTIDTSGNPFALSANRCSKAVRPGSHCDVYVVYVPQGLGTDQGQLSFAFNGETVQVTLTGNAVSSIQTSTQHFDLSPKKSQAYWTLSAEGDVIPDGEEAVLQGIDYYGVNEEYVIGHFVNNRVTFDIDSWFWRDNWNNVNVYYNGDAEFEPTSWQFQCAPVIPKSPNVRVDRGNRRVERTPQVRQRQW